MGTPCTHTHNERAAAPNGESGCRRPRDDAGSHGGPSGPAPERSFAHPTGPARPTPQRRAGYYRASQGREASGRSHGGVGETPAPGRSPGEGRWTGLLVAVRPALCPRLSRRNPLRSRARPTSAGAMTAPACGPAGAPAKVTPALVRSRSRGQPGPSEAKALLGCRGPEGGPLPGWRSPPRSDLPLSTLPGAPQQHRDAPEAAVSRTVSVAELSLPCRPPSSDSPWVALPPEFPQGAPDSRPLRQGRRGPTRSVPEGGGTGSAPQREPVIPPFFA